MASACGWGPALVERRPLYPVGQPVGEVRRHLDDGAETVIVHMQQQGRVGPLAVDGDDSTVRIHVLQEPIDGPAVHIRVGGVPVTGFQIADEVPVADGARGVQLEIGVTGFGEPELRPRRERIVFAVFDDEGLYLRLVEVEQR